jgi:hypothetical protein
MEEVVVNFHTASYPSSDYARGVCAEYPVLYILIWKSRRQKTTSTFIHVVLHNSSRITLMPVRAVDFDK